MHASSLLTTLGLLATLLSTTTAWSLYTFKDHSCKNKIAFSRQGMGNQECTKFDYNGDYDDVRKFHILRMPEDMKMGVFKDMDDCKDGKDGKQLTSVNNNFCYDWDDDWKVYKVILEPKDDD
ncbi:hypothetical protein F4775DRAFT_588184 [Biscogniauxia sp. FL1348]|nr:hypothetical protein F4775DRAFT_588184 [Biscogniauxia sp. FL1348]